jgi:hypothetical protein
MQKIAFHCCGQLIADDHQIANKNKNINNNNTAATIIPPLLY